MDRPPLPPQRVCSARGCRSPAGWELRWNNPALHTPDRRKSWLACPAHRDHLAGFLDLRGFLRDVVELDGAATGSGPPPAPLPSGE